MTTSELIRRLQDVVKQDPSAGELPAFLDVGNWCAPIGDVVFREKPLIDDPGVYLYGES